MSEQLNRNPTLKHWHGIRLSLSLLGRLFVDKLEQYSVRRERSGLTDFDDGALVQRGARRLANLDELAVNVEFRLWRIGTGSIDSGDNDGHPINLH